MTTTARTRVLFVDDEPLVLQGLQRMLRPLNSQWDMAFVESGPKALEAMARDPYGVIVSDMRMPGMNGAELLGELSKSYPGTVRIILSGHADKNLIVQCVGTAHQFLSKPCEPEELKAAVARGHYFQNSIKSEILKEIIAKMDTLPSVPSLFHKIIEKLRDENCSLDDIADIIASDVAMTAKLLKVVNSAFFGLRREVTSAHEAVTFLGIDTIKALVLAANAFGCFEGAVRSPVNVETMWSHSVTVGNWCKRIAQHENGSRSETDECFLAGMLHDVGRLALSANLPELYSGAMAMASHEMIPLHRAEENVFGANHAEIGGWLLSLWGLPSRVVDAISFHHDPCHSGVTGFSALAALHAADAFASEQQENRCGAEAGLDLGYFTDRSLADKLDDWKSLMP